MQSQVLKESYFGIMVSPDGRFFRDGKEKKVVYATNILGKKATAKLTIMIDGKVHYWQAAKLVAKAYLADYEDGCNIIYKDGDIHNIKAENLCVVSPKRYYEYTRRNAGYSAATIDQKKEKLRRIIKEAGLTLNYLETKDFTEINAYVENHLLPILKDYCMRTLFIGRSTTEHIVCEGLYCLYDCIWSGNAVANYERWMKKILLNWKKKGTFGYMAEGFTRQEWETESKQIDFNILTTKYNVAYGKSKG